MDICQPIYVAYKNSSEKYFIILVQDEELYKQNNPEQYFYGITNIPVKLSYYSSAKEAFDAAMKNIPNHGDIKCITSSSFNNFLQDTQLKGSYY